MRALRTVLVAALAIGLLWLFLRNADLSRVWEAMRTARLDFLIIAVALTFVLYLVRTERWQYLLEPLGPTRFWVALRATVIGFAASAVLPARAGEVLRPYLLARQEGLAATAAFATIVVERLLDLAAVLLLLAAYLIVFDAGAARAAPELFGAVRLGALITTPITLALLGVMTALAGDPERLQRFILGAERLLPGRAAQWLASLARTFAEGLAIVRRPVRLLASLGLSLAIWIIIATQAWLVARAFGIPIPYPGAYLLTALLVVGVALPTPGGVGGFHEAFRLGATAFFGADNDAAVGAAIVLHVATFVPVVMMGLWFVARDGVDLARLQTIADAESGEHARSRPRTGETDGGLNPRRAGDLP